ncbi:endonuclease/exonuclease/phosphatase family protein [Pseudoxanthomonas winnipegensis]|nr:endonuclease/exonuclease/phosphatase family protein [Pseudoxanthomonas winnipegensis]
MPRLLSPAFQLLLARRRQARLMLMLLIGLPLAQALAATPDTSAALKVMSFNVRTPADTNENRWENRRDLLARVVTEQAPDVMGTQELVKRQADDLAARLPQYAWFGQGRRGGDEDEHMGVFYRKDRLKVLDSGDFWLSDTPEVPGSISWGHPLPRMVTWARFQRIADGRTFVLYNTHFPYRDQDEAARVKCAQLIAQRLKALPAGEPVVLTGDFNTTPDSAPHATLTALLHDSWESAPSRSGPDRTFHDFTGTPDKRIDWILSRGLQPLSVATLTDHDGARYPSDHFPVVATFAFPARASARP